MAVAFLWPLLVVFHDSDEWKGLGPWLGFLQFKCWPTSDSVFFFSFCFNYNSSSVCLCECAGLPLLSGKHYRVSLENLSKPAQSSSTFKGSSLVTYCKCKHTEKVALYRIYPPGVIYFTVIFFFHTWATLSLPQISTCGDSTEGTPFPCCLNLFFSMIWFSYFFRLTCLPFSGECCLFQL